MKKSTTKPLPLGSDILPRPLSLLDIGARGGLQWPWDQLTSNLIKNIFIEPDPEEAEKLRKEYHESGRGVVIESALWCDERELSLYINKSPGTSSVFEPNRKFINQFPDADRFDVVKKINFSTKTVDGLFIEGVLPTIDFAKIDVQGAELAILKGGVKHFRDSVIGLELEVEFQELYSCQPLFYEVDAYVRNELGLELWDLAKTYWKYKDGKDIGGSLKGRLIFGDALYLRPISGLAEWLAVHPKELGLEKLMMLLISTLVYGFTDYAQAILNEKSLNEYFSKPSKDRLSNLISGLGNGFRPFTNGNAYIYLLFDALACAFKPSHDGWATRSQGRLGSYRGFIWR